MNANFKIVWFEDEDLSEFRENIERTVNEYSLTPIIDKYIGQQYSVDILKNADIILADFDLQSNITGVKIVDDIRKENIVTDVIFYSSKFKDMLDEIKKVNPLMEGIFCAKRGRSIGDSENSFNEKFRLLVERIIKRAESSENLRGMLLEYASIFDAQINSLIIKFCNYCNDNFCYIRDFINGEISNSIIDSTYKKCKKEKLKRCGKKNCCFSPVGINDLAEINNNNFELYTRSRILDKIIYALVSNGILSQDMKGFHKNFDSNIISYRNALAHQKTTEKRLYLKNTNTYLDINQDLFIKLRQSIKQYEDIFIKLENINNFKISYS